MANCNHDCENCSSNCGERKTQSKKFIANGNIKNVIGVLSGKGGVGKSLVTGLLSSEMRKQGFRTSILDADITGPSIPKMFGLHEKALSDGHFIFPAITKDGIKVISMNLCLQNENDPVVWRAPVLSGVLQQFWEDVEWGDTDYMFIDMPPGTGDVALTVFQSLPIKGIIIVTTPQELVSMIVEKALGMAKLMNVPVLGIVENMSYFECPNCKEKYYIFGENHSDIKINAHLPMSPEIAKLCDQGKIEDFDASEYLSGILTAIKNLS